MKYLILGCLWLACMGGVFSQECDSVTIRNLMTSATEVGVVSVSWQPVPNNITFSHYLLTYQPNSHSEPLKRTIGRDAQEGPSEITESLRGLLNFVSYSITVKLACPGGVFGPASVSTVTTMQTIPSSSVRNLTQNTISSSGSSHLVWLQWEPLQSTQWNGEPVAYDVSIFRTSNPNHDQTHRVPFPSNMLLLRLDSGKYAATVATTNAVGTSAMVTSSEFTVGDGSGSSSVTDYPLFYIIIPGIVFLAFIIVITIVIFKKVHEHRKQSVSYVRDQWQ